MTSRIWLTIWAVSLSLCLVAVEVQAGTGSRYKVQGTVIAITLTQTPPLIVVKTPLGPKNHMTVGATVTAQTKILRGEEADRAQYDSRGGSRLADLCEGAWRSACGNYPGGCLAR